MYEYKHSLTFQIPLLAPDELLYFADVCAGPGGFSEYVLWRRHQQLAAALARLSGSASSRQPEPKPDVYALLSLVTALRVKHHQ